MKPNKKTTKYNPDKPSPYDLSSISKEELKKRRRLWVDWNDKPDPYDLSRIS